MFGCCISWVLWKLGEIDGDPVLRGMRIRDTPELPGGSLNLMFLCVSHLYFSGPEARFERLPKLVRATIAIGHVLLEVVNNVKFLHIDWVEGLEVIKHCPNLQILDIDMV